MFHYQELPGEGFIRVLVLLPDVQGGSQLPAPYNVATELERYVHRNILRVGRRAGQGPYLLRWPTHTRDEKSL